MSDLHPFNLELLGCQESPTSCNVSGSVYRLFGCVSPCTGVKLGLCRAPQVILGLEVIVVGSPSQTRRLPFRCCVRVCAFAPALLV
jgi:hypothetical protein